MRLYEHLASCGNLQQLPASGPQKEALYACEYYQRTATHMRCLILLSGACYYEKGFYMDEVRFKCDDNLDRPGTASCQEPGDWVEG